MDRAPNRGTFVIDAANIFSTKERETLFWRLRHLFVDTRARMPMMVVTAETNPFEDTPDPNLALQQFAMALQREHLPKTVRSVMAIVIVDAKKAWLHFGPGLSPEFENKAKLVFNDTVVRELSSDQSTSKIMTALETIDQMIRAEDAAAQSKLSRRAGE